MVSFPFYQYNFHLLFPVYEAFVSTPSIDHAKISWNDTGTPVADQFDDVYFSNHDGLAETRYVFLAQNQLPERWHTASA